MRLDYGCRTRAGLLMTTQPLMLVARSGDHQMKGRIISELLITNPTHIIYILGVGLMMPVADQVA